MSNRDKLFMSVAGLMAQQSKCIRVQVGAVITINDRIISTGWNGTPSGYRNCCDWALYDQPDIETAKSNHQSFSILEIHAEANAIAHAARNGVKLDGATIYTNWSPCFQCAKLIIAAGIKRLVFKTLYDRENSLVFLSNCGIIVTQLETKS